MRRYIQLILVNALIFLSPSCVFDVFDSVSGDGNVKTEIRDVEAFTSLEASHGLHVYITFGKPASLEVEADANLHEYIRTEVHSGNLRIYSERSIRNAREKNIRITVPFLEEIEASSAADIRCENSNEAEKLILNSSSAGRIRIETISKEVRLEASSSGSIEIRGETNELEADVSSAGRIDADRLVAKSGDVSASSAGNMSICVTEEINADASSAGSIQYRGEPENKRINKSSAGSVSER